MEHKALTEWINENIIKRNSTNYRYDTSHIRLVFEKDTNIHVSNDDVNTVMLQLGFRASSFANDPYLTFNISSQSPALLKYQNEIYAYQ